MANPKYSHSKEQSGEFCRQALALMSKQPAALHPVHYAIWYEYVSGINADLKRAIDALAAAGKVLGEDEVNALYQQHVAEIDEAEVQRIATGVQDMLAKVSLSARQTGDQAKQYGSALDQWEKTLSLPDAAGAGLRAMMQNTGLMQESVNGLKSRLDESQSEIETLRVELVRAREEAMCDALTGLRNRKGFERRLSEQLGPRMTLPENLSLLMLDIDHFKRVNDTFGHLFGDKVIRTVAQIVKDNIKGQDIGVRYGGEEFLVYLPETSLDGAAMLAEKLRRLIASSRIKRISSDEIMESVTISIGVASYRRGETLEALIGRADQALYASKSSGRNRVTAATAAAG